MADGFLAEVQTLLERDRPIGRTARQALGYRELLSHLEEDVPLEDALETARERTRRFARRQLKWYERDPRIEWIELDSSGEVSHAEAIARATSLVGTT